MIKKITMIKKRSILLVTLPVILVILLTAGWLISQPGLLSNPKPPPAAPQVQLPTAQVTITTQGFVPQTILLKKGSSVTWTNTDNKPHQVSSDPHPTHTGLPALGQGKLISPGSSFTLTFEKVGTFTYHDEENPLKFKGVVIVK